MIQVRLALDGMRHQIVHAFANHVEELKLVAAKAVADALTEAEFSREVKEHALRILTERIKELVHDEVNQAVYSPEVQDAVRKAMAQR